MRKSSKKIIMKKKTIIGILLLLFICPCIILLPTHKEIEKRQEDSTTETSVIQTDNLNSKQNVTQKVNEVSTSTMIEETTKPKVEDQTQTMTSQTEISQNTISPNIQKQNEVVTTTITTTNTILNVEENTSDILQADNFYCYMDFNAITDTSSKQYEFQQLCWTDSQGLRRQGDDYVVALGSYFSTNIGDRFSVTLDNGTTYTVVLGDCKADYHTNSTNQYTYVGNKINIIEFIVDTRFLYDTVRQSGDIGTYSNLAGNVVSITKI